MEEKVTIPPVAQYFDKYAVNGIGKGMDRILIKNQLVDAFRKEIFGLVALRSKKTFKEIPPEGDPEALRIAKSVIKEEMKRWQSLIRMFEKYRETSGLLSPDDLKIESEVPEGSDQDIPENVVVSDM